MEPCYPFLVANSSLAEIGKRGWNELKEVGRSRWNICLNSGDCSTAQFENDSYSKRKASMETSRHSAIHRHSGGYLRKRNDAHTAKRRLIDGLQSMCGLCVYSCVHSKGDGCQLLKSMLTVADALLFYCFKTFTVFKLKTFNSLSISSCGLVASGLQKTTQIEHPRRFWWLLIEHS